MGKLQEEDQDLVFWGLTFLPPDRALCLLHQGTNITEASCLLFPLLAIQAFPYNDVLNWLQVYYMGDWTGAYVDPALTDF